MQLHGGQGAGQVGDRSVRVALLGIVQHHVPLAEGATLRVLSGEPDWDAFHQKRTERERLCVSPVDSAFGAECGSPPVQLLLELRVDRKSLRPGQELVVERGQHLNGKRGFDLHTG